MRRGLSQSVAGTAGVLAIALAVGAAGPGAAAAPVLSTPVLSPTPVAGPYLDPVFKPVRTADGVVYGRSRNVAGELQDLVLAVWEPAGHDEEFRPAVVWAAGGGFVHNRGRDRLYWMPELVQRGYVVVSIEYRIRPDMPYGASGIAAAGAAAVLEANDAARDAQHDMQAAVRWVRAHAADLRVDPGRIATAGYSAGAIMSLLAAFNSHDPGDSGNPGLPSHVAAAVSGAGGVAPGLQGTMEPGEPPILVFHGTHDTVVPVAASVLPCAATLAAGNVCEAHLYPGEQHGLEGCCAESLVRETVSFLQRRMIAVPRLGTELGDLGAAAHGARVMITGRLGTADGRPLGGERVLARSETGGWAQVWTATDGSFSIVVDAPDHGRATEVLVRYEGRSHANRLLTRDVAPAHARVTASWGN